MVISRRRIGAKGGHRAGHRIKMILPHQLVREGKRVALKLESADGLLGRRRHDYLAARVSFSTGWPAPGRPASVSSADSTLVPATKAETSA